MCVEEHHEPGLEREHPSTPPLRTDGLEATWLEDWMPEAAHKLQDLATALLSVSEVHMDMVDEVVTGDDQVIAEADLEEWMTKAKDATIETVHALVDTFVQGVLVDTGMENTLLVPFLEDLRDSIAEQSVAMFKALQVGQGICPDCGAPMCCDTAAENLDSWRSLA